MLQWNLEHREKLGQYRRYQEATGEDPDDMADAPALYGWNQSIWSGFNLLSSARPIHMGGVGYIPLSEIVVWMNEARIQDVDDRQVAVDMIRALDSVFVSHANSKDTTNGN